MIKVGLVTTTEPEHCGIRVYGEDLVTHAAIDNPDVVFTMIGRPFDGPSILERANKHNVEIIHVNHVDSLFGCLTTHDVLEMKKSGFATMCTLHDSLTDNRGDFTNAFDRVVVHQATDDGFKRINFGIPYLKKGYSVRRKRSDFIGTSGFPLGFKNYPLAAKLAHAVGMKLLAFMPLSQYGDASAIEREIKREDPHAEVHIGFPPHCEIVKELAECAFTLFPYNHANTGIGGSARVGIGAQRPVVISNVVRFADILSDERYRDEFYVIPSSYPTFEQSLPVVQKVIDDIALRKEKIPFHTLNDMNWRKSANAYVALYRELVR